MAAVPETPFDSVENAHEYVHLLVEAITEARREIEEDVTTATEPGSERRLEALQLVQYKLIKLEQHMRSGGRLLNDLRTLRRLLFDERQKSSPSEDHTAMI